MIKTPNTKTPEKVEVDIKVVLLEDVAAEAERIRGFIDSNIKSINIANKLGLTYSITKLEKKEDVFILMEESEQVPDWIFCDLNLKDDEAGEEVANAISRVRYPTDVLLYSQGGVLPKDLKITENRYGLTLTANRDEIDATIRILTWRAAFKMSDPEYLRGLILSRATDTELLIDECLVRFFRINEDLRTHFRYSLLKSEGNGPQNKYGVIRSFFASEYGRKLSKPTVDLDLIEAHLKRIFPLRNAVAHGLAVTDKRGGLYIINRITPVKKKKSEDYPPPEYSSPISRADAMAYFHTCYKTDNELSGLIEYLE